MKRRRPQRDHFSCLYSQHRTNLTLGFFFLGAGGHFAQRKSVRMIPKTVWLLCLWRVYLHVVNCYDEPGSTDSPAAALVDQRALYFLQAKQRHYVKADIMTLGSLLHRLRSSLRMITKARSDEKAHKQAFRLWKIESAAISSTPFWVGALISGTELCIFLPNAARMLFTMSRFTVSINKQTSRISYSSKLAWNATFNSGLHSFSYVGVLHWKQIPTFCKARRGNLEWTTQTKHNCQWKWRLCLPAEHQNEDTSTQVHVVTWVEKMWLTGLFFWGDGREERPWNRSREETKADLC